MPTVILLAAGRSSRTWPFTDKIFWEFLGKTLLEHQIETLTAAGLNDICIVGNEDNIQKIKNITQKLTGKFTYTIQKNLNQGIRGGILAAKNTIKENPILVVCSNDIVDKNIYKKLLIKTKKKDSQIICVGKIVDKYFPGGYLVTENNIISKVVEKPGGGNEPSNLVTLLIHYFSNPSVLLEKLKERQEGDQYEEVLQELFDNGVQASALAYDGFWQAVKYPWDFLALTEYFLGKQNGQHIHKNTSIAETVVIRGDVYIDEGVKIYDHAVINGPCYIGKNTTIANHSLVRAAHIGENCVVGQGTEVARSYIRNNSWTHRNFVGDSVLDSNVSFGAGTVTGNLRLDEKEISSIIKDERINSQRNKLGGFFGENVRIGINCSLMPGIKIGKNSFVAAEKVSCDIPENTFAPTGDQKYWKINTFQAPTRDIFE